MLANAAYSPLWSSSSNQGFVCLACLRQWQRARSLQQRSQRRHTQVRWNSDVAVPSTSQPPPQSSDSWFDTINDINDAYGLNPPNRPGPDSVGKSSDEANKARSIFSPEERKTRPQVGAQPTELDSLQAKLRKTVHVSASKSALASNSQQRAQSSTKSSESNDAARANFEAAFLSGVSRHKQERPDPQKPGESASKFSGRIGGKVQTVNDLLGQLVPGLTSQVRALAAEQDAELEKRKQNEAGMKVKRRSKSVTRSTVAHTTFQSSAHTTRNPTPRDNKARVPAEIATHLAAPDAQKAITAKPIWKAKTSSERSGLGGSLVHRARAKWVELQERGGGLVTEGLGSPDKVTHNSLSESDTVSIKRVASGAMNAASLGMMAPSSKAPKRNIEDSSNEIGKSMQSAQASPRVPSRAKAVTSPSLSMEHLLTNPAAKIELKGSNGQTKPPSTVIEGKGDVPASKEANSDTDFISHTPDSQMSEVVVAEPTEVPDSSAYSSLATLYGSRLQQTSTSDVYERPTERAGLANAEQLVDSPQRRSSARLVRRSFSRSLSPERLSDRAHLPARARRTWSRRTWSKRICVRRIYSAAPESKSEDSRQDNHTTTSQSAQQEPSAEEGTAAFTGLSMGEAMGRRKHDHGSGQDPPPAGDLEPSAEPVSGGISTVLMALSELEVKSIDIPQPSVPYLEYGLDRVLFNPGVYQLQDPASRVYNFDPYLQKIMPVSEFDFDSLKEYKPSSQDPALSALAQKHDSKYIGSTSSMTSTLAHFHYLLSNWRPLNFDMLSRGFLKDTTPSFTKINQAPAAIFLRWQNGTYAIDPDKEFDSGNVLMLLGKSMELLLTLPRDDYEKYRKSDPRAVPEEQKTGPEAFQYTTMGDFLMRSQLDAYDPRLSGNGTFDLKTRAVVSVRMQAHDHEEMSGYEIVSLHGRFGSYEREYYDMIRSTMLKYSLQARMGRMNGIFVAYHNAKRIFGFQYISISDMDRALHGQTDTCLGDQEYKGSLQILNDVLNRATAKFPKQSLRVHFETQQAANTEGNQTPASLQIFAEPISDEEIDKIQNAQKETIKTYERTIMGNDDTDEKFPVDAGTAVVAPGSSAIADEPSPTELVDNEIQSVSENDTAATTADSAESLAVRSSDSHADKPFLNKVDVGDDDKDLKPLFHASVICLSRVNGEVPSERAQKLTKDDKWEVEYLIKEYDINKWQWALYEDMRARRRYALSSDEDEASGDPEAEAEAQDKKKERGYLHFLRSMSLKGGQLREKLDQLEEGAEIVRADQPLPKHREEIESLEDYMDWMYKKQME